MSRKSIVSVAVITPLVLSVMCVSPANAATNTDPATNSFGQCLTTPTSDKTVNHAEQAHVDKTVVPGVGQVSHLERRWNRQIPAVEAVSHSESPFQRTITGSAEVSHEQWLYQQFIAGNKEQSHQEHQFSRENPGKTKVSHLLYQFSRENPGQQTVSHQEFQFTRTVPGQVEQLHQEYKYQQVTKNSHTENRYKKSIKLYTVEHKKVQIPYQGKDHDKLVTWLNKIGATNLGGNWWQLPDAVVAAAGVNPFNVAQSGSVNMNAYGGPSVTVSYQITGIETYDQPPAGSFVSLGNQTVYYTGGTSFSLNASDAIWVNGSLAGWNSFDARSVNDADTVTPYNNGNWTTDVNPAGFTKVDQRTVIDQPKTDERTEYRMVDGSPTTDLAQAAWFKESSFGGWSQFDTAKLVEDQQYVAPFTQYRTADGSVTTDVAKAAQFTQSTFEGWSVFGTPEEVVDQAYAAPFTEYRSVDGSPTTDLVQAAWFTQPSFDEWSPFGASKKVVTQEKTDDQTLYLTKDTQGNLGQTAVKAEASWFTGDDTSVDVPWTKIDTETVVDHQAVPDKTVYITKDADGTFSETGDVGQASWINTADKTVDLAVWQQMVDEQGNPLVRIVEDKKAVPSDTEYYVHAAKPTSKLGESNWTTDKPAGWTFVDDRTIADTKATPAVTTEKKVVDKAAWVEQVRTPAVYGECALASTGANDTWGVAGLGLLALGLGGGAITIGAMRRARHRRDDA